MRNDGGQLGVGTADLSGSGRKGYDKLNGLAKDALEKKQEGTGGQIGDQMTDRIAGLTKEHIELRLNSVWA